MYNYQGKLKCFISRMTANLYQLRQDRMAPLQDMEEGSKDSKVHQEWVPLPHSLPQT